MNDIAEASYDPESYRQIMAVISRRLKEEVGRRSLSLSACDMFVPFKSVPEY